MTIARIWRTRVAAGRAADYQHFANSRSLAMFRAHDGFIGVIFGSADAERVVISFWRDAAAVSSFEASQCYQETVRELETSGLILGSSSVDAYMVDGGTLDRPPC